MTKDMIDLNQIKEMADNVKGSMEQLIRMTDEALKNLPEDERKQVSPVQKDIHNILDAVKQGDTMKIHEIQRKYASSNHK
jgi:vacuolar-type H+-ATPase subunit E/Vma4